MEFPKMFWQEVDELFEGGLHERLTDALRADNHNLAGQILQSNATWRPDPAKVVENFDRGCERLVYDEAMRYVRIDRLYKQYVHAYANVAHAG